MSGEDGAESAPKRASAGGVEVLERPDALDAHGRPNALEQSLFCLVEEVQASRVEAKLDAVTGGDGHSRVDARRHLVAADRPVQELVGAESLDHVDLHVDRGRAVADAAGDRPRPEAERAAREAREQERAAARERKATAAAAKRAREEQLRADRARQRSIDNAIRTGGGGAPSPLGPDTIRGLFGSLFGGKR